MISLLMLAVLAMAPGDKDAKAAADTGPDLGGKWLIVYAEEKGRRIQSWEQMPATFKDGALVYEKDGKEQTINLKFGAHQTVKASGGKAEAGASGESDGVYIAAQDYLCLSLNGGTFTAGEKATGKDLKPIKPALGTDEPGNRPSGSDFNLILRKQRSGAEK
jgi:hypothetical protein